MRATPHLLGIPRDIRDKIYKDYITAEDGYMYNPSSGKLTTNGQPYLLSLMYTCRQIASEMGEPAICYHIINFKTLHSKDLRLRAFRYSYLLDLLWREKGKLMERCRPMITCEDLQQLSQRYTRIVRLKRAELGRPIINLS
ncbi:hypothetical protein BU23DRAFT_270970 [Bimuria novae-zelandiae CBS 107.79]|uniref:Uncharacterized protein n=1 Tax=Bimuria novae-zelandiae CBS 107.79 TaxID=1447943 RepID=A0A6A5VPL4_9PLEO|nr:hypothetical protein BU23DRAFT_270970 [Bimuria novae-zelandiae CBS 107.79]